MAVWINEKWNWHHEFSLSVYANYFYVAFKDNSLIICNDTILLGYKIIRLNFVSRYKLISVA